MKAQVKVWTEAGAKARVVALAAVSSAPMTLACGQHWTNTLGMVFAGVPGAPAFSIWETRVQDYQAFATATGRSWERPSFTQGPTHPAVNVSWNDSQAFCQWLTGKERREGRLATGQEYRLPSDAEWSLAVGLENESRSTPVYPWGTQWPPPRGAGNYGSSLLVDTFDYTAPVGSFAANQSGLYDLGGNVWEWCDDWYDKGKQLRTLRGGAWHDFDPSYLLSWRRYGHSPDNRVHYFGFRSVLGVGSSAPASGPSLTERASAAVDARSSRTSSSPPVALAPSPASLQPGQHWTNTLGMVFAGVPGGPAFSIWETRVQDYQAFATATGRSWEKPSFTQGSTHPAVNVSWYDAHAFCQWLTAKERGEGELSVNQSYRLPTDAEWSVAVGLPAETGTTPRDKCAKIKDVFLWGNQRQPPKNVGNYHRYMGVDAFERTSPVGSFAANQFELCDLGGNAEEWCEDEYLPGSGERVMRGRSWDYLIGDPNGALASGRVRGAPSTREEYIGFRVVMLSGSVPSAVEAAPPALQSGERWTNSLGMVLTTVTGTTAWFRIWETRVQDYQAFAAVTSRAWEKPDFAQGTTHPPVNVSWNDAQAFCQWLTDKERGEGRLTASQGYRLASDGEWSLAAGLPTEPSATPRDKDWKGAAVFPWGTQWPPPKGAGNYADESSGLSWKIAGYCDGFAQTAPVGSFAANQFGLYDLGGNVWEWCGDEYYPDSGARVLRGGSWDDVERSLLSSFRNGVTSTTRNYNFGFRVVLAGGSVP